MKIKVSNDIRIEEPNKKIVDYCHKKLTIDNPEFLTKQRLGMYLGSTDRKIKLYYTNAGSLVLPFGCLQDVWKLSSGAKFELNFHPFLGNKLIGDINLYDYQEEALNSLLRGKNGILHAPCGSGKTQIGLELIKKIGGRALWLTHTKKLLKQSRDRCEKYFTGDFGEITEGKVEIAQDITFATVQTMSKLDPGIYKDAFDIVVVDECHHCVGTPTKVMQFYKILTNCNARYKYGLSATLTRSDNLIYTLYSIIGNILHTIGEEKVGNKIIKAKHIKIDIPIEYDPSIFLDFDGTINYGKLITMLSENEERENIIIDNVKEMNRMGRKQLLLCHRVAQVRRIADKLKDIAQVSCITGTVKEKNREFNSDIVVATYSLAKEGLDIPSLDVLHLVTPQKNESTTKQAVGRIERNIEGKQEPICFDYVDTNIDYCNTCYKVRRRILRHK